MTTETSKTHIDAFEYRKKVRRTLYISGLTLVNAIIVGFIAKGLVLLISLFTQLFFFGNFSFHEVSPSENSLGYWIILIPSLGGLIVGLMARFGSPAIRGHGIPEAMEKIAKGESKIHPLITLLKPLSAAVSIGTGGPFGAEGPIISTGGALGSFCGQTLHITAQERKVLLAAGATAGMTAIFGTPFAAILLAIELLLFEFSSRSFIPVMIACVTGACMHFLLFDFTPTFPMPEIGQVSTGSIVAYSIIGLIIGFASVIVTKAIYFVEDLFERLPIHWMWWPALGGIAVGAIGIFAPDTLGVGYQNITHSLSGQLPITILISLCFWKFVSWAIALGSGTSGGTLAPLLTIGSSLGCLLGMLGQHYFPEANITLPLAALVGMAALFAGAARALLTSIVFAMETTMQESTLLPLIAGCVASYLVSFILMKTTIMTEKIHRRGIKLPDSYYPDLLETQCIRDIMPIENTTPIIAGSLTVGNVKAWLQENRAAHAHNVFIVADDITKEKIGIISKEELFKHTADTNAVQSLITHKLPSLYSDNSLQLAVEFILKTGQDTLSIEDRASRKFLGVVSSRDILHVFEQRLKEENDKEKHIHMSAKARAVFRDGINLIRKKSRR
ncbi:chloride channel protein [Dawidia cretensis]|uniref:chloride channel protein n=1 Tax=Dawidia cretensis TaxID=2782350 RepID=UPI0020B1F7B8|nr:chloride channel protein [Dawidia cretensis]